MNEIKIKRSLFIEGREWHDKINGNSYFSARVWVDGQIVAVLTLQYGYESHYFTIAMDKLVELAYVPTDYAKKALWHLRDDFGIDYYYQKSNTNKKEMFVQGKYYEEIKVA